jgi:YD repeat-containing protein
MSDDGAHHYLPLGVEQRDLTQLIAIGCAFVEAVRSTYLLPDIQEHWQVTKIKRLVSMKRIAAVVIIVAVYSCILSSVVQGQGIESCQQYNQILRTYPLSCLHYWDSNSVGDPNAPATRVCCNASGGLFSQTCVALGPSCGAPPAAPSETCLSCNSGRTAQGSNPIDFATGNTYITQSDIRVPGLGGGLSLIRTWNSMLPAVQQSLPFMFGAGWRSSYEERLIFNSPDSFLKYARGDGSTWSFSMSTEGPPNMFSAVAPASDPTMTITKGSPSWTLTSKSGEKRLFNANSGLLVAIIDRNGNTTQLSYDASNRLTSVADPASRHLNFTYVNAASPLVSGVSADVGISLSYAYDGQGRLNRITKPDNTTVSFQYDTNFNITAVLDSDGKTLESHTYDSAHRGLTSSRANGVEGVTVSYPQ